MLEDLGCEVDVASDGQEAVDCAMTRDYDLILMDMQMPKMDGLEATRAIRSLPRHARTPIVALTANAFAEDRQRCFAAGIPGIHPPAAMCGSPQRRAEFQALLCRFVELHGQDMERLETLMTNGQREEARKLAHDLKGIAGLIGARHIAQLSNDIVVALRETEAAGIETLIASCAAELGNLVAATAKMPARLPAPG